LNFAVPSGIENACSATGGNRSTGEPKDNAALIAELLTNGSIELTGKYQHQINQVKDLLPFGTDIYLSALPDRPLATNLECIAAIRSAGFNPVPHIAARHVRSRNELKEFLDSVIQQQNVRKILLIGGDLPEPMGPYSDALTVLKDGILKDAGICEIGVAGYPEGHPRIPNDIIRQSIIDKVQLAREQELGIFLITQFSFAPGRIVDYCAKLARTIPELPVYAGMAGPTNPVSLLRYARICGVSASLRALTGLGFKAARLVTRTEPNEQLTVLARYCAGREDCNVMGVHIFSFGGFVESVKWMQDRQSLS
jgi:methylenetetrahydrofolate reductase (NADPH)